jgi:hypothetical protein
VDPACETESGAEQIQNGGEMREEEGGGAEQRQRNVAEQRQRNPSGECLADASQGGWEDEGKGGRQEGDEGRTVVVATPGRVGSTLLYNAARLLLQHLHPSVTAGFADITPDGEERRAAREDGEDGEGEESPLLTPDDEESRPVYPALDSPGGWRAWRSLGTSVLVKTHGFSADLCDHLDLLVPQTLLSLSPSLPHPPSLCLSLSTTNLQNQTASLETLTTHPTPS